MTMMMITTTNNCGPVTKVAGYGLLAQLGEHFAGSEKVRGSSPLQSTEEFGMKCIVKDCKNHTHQGTFVGELCAPCHEFITTGEGLYSQAYRNAIKTASLLLNQLVVKNGF